VQKTYRANGKVLLTSEYMILHGAKALALPLCLGQSLIVSEKERQGLLHWRATYKNKTWFETTISLGNMSVEFTSDKEKSDFLVFMLNKTLEAMPGFMKKMEAGDVTTVLDFDPAWGFGSSSTLTSLVSQWAGIDPMQLHFRISRGSGYDVACAVEHTPILYELIDDMPVIENVAYDPPYLDKLWLVYLGTKQRSDRSIAEFFTSYAPRKEDIGRFSDLTLEFLKADTLEELARIVRIHELHLGEILHTEPIGKTRFAGFNGFVKSLGAWGGDFALVGSDLSSQLLINEMKGIGIHTVFSLKEIMCNEKNV
jgi:mevalonate kinase